MMHQAADSYKLALQYRTQLELATLLFSGLVCVTLVSFPVCACRAFNWRSMVAFSDTTLPLSCMADLSLPSDACSLSLQHKPSFIQCIIIHCSVHAAMAILFRLLNSTGHSNFAPTILHFDVLVGKVHITFVNQAHRFAGKQHQCRFLTRCQLQAVKLFGQMPNLALSSSFLRRSDSFSPPLLLMLAVLSCCRSSSISCLCTRLHQITQHVVNSRFVQNTLAEGRVKHLACMLA